MAGLGKVLKRRTLSHHARPSAVLKDVDIVIVEHLDPEHLTPGGIDTIVHDMVRFSPTLRFAIVGVAHDKSTRLGEWRLIDFAGRVVPLLQVSTLDRSTPPAGIRVPHSVTLALGVLRFRNKLPRTVYHAHRIETGAVLILLRLGYIVQFIHNDSSGLLGTNSDSVWRHLWWIYRAIERLVLKQAAGVAIFNETDGKRIKRIRPDLVITKTWFDPDVFRMQPQPRDDQVTVCWVGRLDSQKDPMLAVEVLHQLVRLSPHASLRIAGTGALRQQVEDYAASLGVSQSVQFLGALTRPEVADLMSTSSVLLLTSHYEGSPTVLIEAAATGLPVVATSAADPDHALVLGSNGIAVEGRDPLDLARAVVEAVSYSRTTCHESAQARAGDVVVPRLTRIGRTDAVHG